MTPKWVDQLVRGDLLTRLKMVADDDDGNSVEGQINEPSLCSEISKSLLSGPDLQAVEPAAVHTRQPR